MSGFTANMPCYDWRNPLLVSFALKLNSVIIEIVFTDEERLFRIFNVGRQRRRGISATLAPAEINDKTYTLTAYVPSKDK